MYTRTQNIIIALFMLIIVLFLSVILISVSLTFESFACFKECDLRFVM